MPDRKVSCHPFPLRARAALAAALCAAMAMSACESTPDAPRPYPSPSERNVLEQRAWNLAAQAEEAMAEDDVEAAAKLYQEALTVAPNLAEIWNNYGNLLMHQDAYAEALKAFQNAAQLDSRDPRYVYNQGLIFFDRRRFDMALDLFIVALNRDPDHLLALRGAIVSAVESRRPSEQALEWIARAELLDRDPRWRSFYQTHRLNFERALAED